MMPDLDKIVSSGTRLATMTRIVIDVSAYLNENRHYRFSRR